MRFKTIDFLMDALIMAALIVMFLGMLALMALLSVGIAKLLELVLL